MNNRKRHFIKKEKKGNLIGSIVMILIAIAFGLVSPFTFTAKAINDGNMFFMVLPFMLILTVFAALIIWGMLKK